jgi:hypothetical protein
LQFSKLQKGKETKRLFTSKFDNDFCPEVFTLKISNPQNDKEIKRPFSDLFIKKTRCRLLRKSLKTGFGRPKIFVICRLNGYPFGRSPPLIFRPAR